MSAVKHPDSPGACKHADVQHVSRAIRANVDDLELLAWALRAAAPPISTIAWAVAPLSQNYPDGDFSPKSNNVRLAMDM